MYEADGMTFDRGTMPIEIVDELHGYEGEGGGIQAALRICVPSSWPSAKRDAFVAEVSAAAREMARRLAM